VSEEFAGLVLLPPPHPDATSTVIVNDADKSRNNTKRMNTFSESSA
jgi:hypothetical protein